MFRIIGKYMLFDELASGGMATVYVGRRMGLRGFSRTVAIKRMHPTHAKNPSFVEMFMDEARLSARIHHPNVVSTLDVLHDSGELFLVMEYVGGEALSRVMNLAAGPRMVPPAIAVGVMLGVLEGLHAAHEARNERGESLHIVHRDVSPQNILLGAEGIARLVDFGIAKFVGRTPTTLEGEIRGKVAYMSKEQLLGEVLDRRTDVYAASVVLWEMLTGTRLFREDSAPATIVSVLDKAVSPPSAFVPGLPRRLDEVVLKGLDRDRARRYGSAREMARALEEALRPAGSAEIGEWVVAVAGGVLEARAARVRQIESVPLEDVGPSRGVTLPIKIAIVGSLALVLGGGTLALVRSPHPRQERGVETAGPARASADAASPTLSATPEERSSIPASDAGAERASVPAIASSPQRASVQHAPSANVLRRPVPTGRGPACSPPYVIDPSGIRIPKPACID